MLTLLLMLAAQADAGPLPPHTVLIEAERTRAIREGDMERLEQIYAPEFTGITAGGARVDRAALLDIFRRNAGSGLVAENEVLTIRQLEGGIQLVEGRLTLRNPDGRLVSASHYLHVYRVGPNGLHITAGAAAPIAEPPR